MKQNSKKRIVPMLFALLVVLTLVSCCFLGSTFARYTSTGTGSASAEVAKWEIELNGDDITEGADEVTLDKISPDDAAWATDLDRVHASEGVLAATIVNKSDVMADIGVTLGDAPVYYGVNGSGIVGWSERGISQGDVLPSYLETKTTIQVQFAADTRGFVDGSTDWKGYGETVTIKDIAANDGAVYVYVRIVWDTMDVLGQITSDAIDTWLGQNVTKVSCNLSYVAVQSSELPA